MGGGARSVGDGGYQLQRERERERARERERERGEIKNIKIMYRKAIVIVVVVYICTLLQWVMWVFFWLKYVKLNTLCIL